MAIDESGYFWWHSIGLPDGSVTPGEKTREILLREWQNLALPPLPGKTVLDIGAWDGYFSFVAEALGASRVVALDHFVWSLDLTRDAGYVEYAVKAFTNVERPEPLGSDSSWRDDVTLPGKRGFDTAHRALGSAVESRYADFMDCDLESVGTFDIVLFLGVLYHQKEPVSALERLRRVTGELAVIETAAVAFDGEADDRPLLEFLPEGSLNRDPTNWFLPNEAAVHAMLKRSGFAESKTVARDFYWPGRTGVRDFRLTVHAIP